MFENGTDGPAFVAGQDMWQYEPMERLKEGERYERARRWHDHHLDVYFGERDLKQALATYHEEAIGIGTSRSEYGATAEALRRIVVDDLKSVPNGIDYQVHQRDFFMLTPEVLVCQALLELDLYINAHRLKLREMRHSIVAVDVGEEGDEDFRICHIHVSYPTELHGDDEPYPLKEIEEVSAVVDEMIASKTRDLTQAYRKLERMAVHDRLTGLFNRIRLDEKLEHEMRRANRYGSEISLILADIDNFKAVNDEHGHLVGDEVLKELADMLREATRDTDLVGRWGGEEFLVILPETAANRAVTIARRICRMFSQFSHLTDSGQELKLSLSCGVSSYQPGDDVGSLFKRADAALYEAKRGGKNRVHVI